MAFNMCTNTIGLQLCPYKTAYQHDDDDDDDCQQFLIYFLIMIYLKQNI